MVKKCPKCGKPFDVLYPELWRYKDANRYLCSWKCLQAYRRALTERKEEKAMGKITLDMKKKAVQMALNGKDPRDYLRKCGSKNPQNMWWSIKSNLKKVDPETYEKLPDLHDVVKNVSVDKGMPKKADVKTGPDGKEYEKLELEAGGNYQLSVKEEKDGKEADVVMTDEMKQARREYYSDWRKENPDKVCEAQARFWAKKAKQACGKEEKDGVPVGGYVEVTEVAPAPPVEEIVRETEAETNKIRKPVNFGGYDVTAILHPVFGEFHRDEKHDCIYWMSPDGEEVGMTPAEWIRFGLCLPDIMGILGVQV